MNKKEKKPSEAVAAAEAAPAMEVAVTAEATPAEEPAFETITVHFHKNPAWSEEVLAYAESEDEEFGFAPKPLLYFGEEGSYVPQATGRGWYDFQIEVPRGMLKGRKKSFTFVVYDKHNPGNKAAQKITSAKEYWLDSGNSAIPVAAVAPAEDSPFETVTIHFHKNPAWSGELEAYAESEDERFGFAPKPLAFFGEEGHYTPQIAGATGWYTFQVEVPRGILKEKKKSFTFVIYDKHNPGNKVTKKITSTKERWLAKDGKAKKNASAVNNYEENHFVWREHDNVTKASLFVLGVAHLKNKRFVEGILMLLVEIGFFLFMGFYGVRSLINLVTLGTTKQYQYIDDEGYEQTVQGHNSMTMLLSGVIAIVMIAMFALFYLYAFRSTVKLASSVKSGKAYSFKAVLKSFANGKLYIVMLIIPLAGVLIFTIIPLLYMILIAFTNYDQNHQPPGELFDWVGFQNFFYLFGQDANFASTFWRLLLWTLIWAFFSTFTCFFGGMGLAMLIKNNKVKGKVIFRTIFVLTIAIPSFISLLSIGTMLQRDGVINQLLMKYGFTSEPLPFLTDTTWARATVIVVNLWIGMPISMLITTGILMNIPADLFESARIDGAGPWVIFKKIIMPYIMFVCTPYLINAFIANINNFNVIYFLTGGGPASLDNFKGAGGTDLLVTWLYKLTVDNRDYSYASAIGIIIFLISAVLSLIVLRRSSSFKNEGSF